MFGLNKTNKKVELFYIDPYKNVNKSSRSSGNLETKELEILTNPSPGEDLINY